MRKINLKKAITILAIALLFISMLSPIVRADITLTSEFVDPLKNWSFEDRDMPVPYTANDGVFRCPPWESNNGGWRELKGDVSGEPYGEGWGGINLYDVTKVYGAYASKPGDPNWDPVCDLDGDEVVNIYDLVKVTSEYGKEANRVDGSYSWYTSGGGDYQMWQWLDSNTLDAIKGQQVLFSFWFKHPPYEDSLTEDLTKPNNYLQHVDGKWEPLIPTHETVSIETTTVHTGSKSVKIQSSSYDYYMGITFTFNAGKYVNGNLYQRLWFTLREDNKHNKKITVGLEDKDGNDCWQHLDISAYDQWQSYALGVGEQYQESWTLGYDTFDWENIKEIRFDFHQLSSKYGAAYVDGLHFFEDNCARAEIYYEHAGSNDTVCGVWVTPTELKWYNAHVTANLSSTTTAVKVIIHGKPDFNAYVDLASFSICNSTTASSDEGNLSLAVNLFRWETKEVDPGFPDGLAQVSVGLYAEHIDEDYYIKNIQLKVELLPNDGSSSTQEGGLQIWYCEQANEDGYEVDPAAVEEFQNQVFSSSELAIKVIAGAIVGYYVRFPYSLVVTTLVGGAAHYILEHFRSDPNDPTANAHLDPNDYFILERWDYPVIGTPHEFVESATGHYGFEWQFYTESASDFQIRVTASVDWGWCWWDHECGCFRLVGDFWTHAYTDVTINA